VQLGSGAAIVSDSAHAHSGTLSAHFTTGGTAAQDDVVWSTSAGTNTQVWFRLYLYFTANPAVNMQVLCCNITGGSTQAGAVWVTTTGKLRFDNSAFSAIQTTTTSIALNQ